MMNKTARSSFMIRCKSARSSATSTKTIATVCSKASTSLVKNKSFDYTNIKENQLTWLFNKRKRALKKTTD